MDEHRVENRAQGVNRNYQWDHATGRLILQSSHQKKG